MSRVRVDRKHPVISPALLGSGEHLLAGLDLPALGFRVAEHVSSQTAMHVVLINRLGETA